MHCLDCSCPMDPENGLSLVANIIRLRPENCRKAAVESDCVIGPSWQDRSISPLHVGTFFPGGHKNLRWPSRAQINTATTTYLTPRFLLPSIHRLSRHLDQPVRHSQSGLWTNQRHPLTRPLRSPYAFKLHLLANTDTFSILVRLLLRTPLTRPLLSFELQPETTKQSTHSQLPHRTTLEILPLVGEESLRQGPQCCIGADLKPP